MQLAAAPTAATTTQTLTPLTMTRELQFAMSRYARRIAVTIGIDRYAAHPQLRYAVSDARRIGALLRDHGFEVVSILENDQATRAGILELLNHQLPTQVGPKDLVVVFFAGHGATVGDMGYVLPIDTSADITHSAISVQELKNSALHWRNKHTLFLIDACFSGAMFRKPPADLNRNQLAYWEALDEQRLVEILTAGNANETVAEVDGWGTFTRALHSGLGGAADADRDGIVTGRELAEHTIREVRSQTNDRQHPQWGVAEGSGTVRMWDGRRVPKRPERVTRGLIMPGSEDKLLQVHQQMDAHEWNRAERILRQLGLQKRHPVVNLTLAELYLRQDALGNEALVEQELRAAEQQSLDSEQQRASTEIRARLQRAQRGAL